MSPIPVWGQVIAAFVGTIAFALLFGVPRRYYLVCGIDASLGWLLYCVLNRAGLTPAESTFFSTVLVIVLSRIAAARMECPVTVFLTTGIFPLIPGAGIYWMAYYLVVDDKHAALESGIGALKAVVAIVLGIILVFEIPVRVFSFAKPKKA
ncbi:MAG: threonine/serine exporter family protein [Lachnospiraceae bacterium]|nr:threonine/serine exporter family protein [Lachnospiraceae bacterium]